MSKVKNVLLTVAAGVAIGAVLGMLYAPQKGAETRRKLRSLKHKLSSCGCGDEEIEDLDKETLEELSEALQEQLDKVNCRLAK